MYNKHRRFAQLSATAVITWLVFLLAIGIGWILNIVDLIGMTDVLGTGLGILRIVGIFIPPLGAFLGYFY